MPELLLELFSEEIPARMQIAAADDLKRLVAKGLAAAGLEHDRTEAFATPRRLALVVNDLPARQPDTSEERRGPRADAPEKAIEGFLNSVGLTRDEVEERETKKGTFLFATVERKGRATAEVLQEVIEAALAEFPWPKSMRWGAGEIRWVRPLHRILCVFDGAVVPVSFAGVTAGDLSQGHRFLGREPFEVRDFADYRDKLRLHHVVLDHYDRQRMIGEQAAALAADAGLELVEDGALVVENAGLTEWPVCMLGAIDADFMDVPAEALISAMRNHQKYFALADDAGNMAPRFVLVANIDPEDGGTGIVAGNERVLRARLADAKFFWDQDRRTPLAGRVARLGDIVFHKKLGTVADKVDRVTALALKLEEYVPGAMAEENDVARAAHLCKADLVTGMVGEFPELQGVMGRHYALNDGENERVAQAIADHYKPLGPNDECPTAPVSVAVALADKLDTLVGFWAIDEKPTGSKDPYALRRAALGVIRLALENGLRLPLHRAFDAAAEVHGVTSVADDLMAFFAERLKVHLRERGVRHDLITAVFALAGEDDLVRLVDRADALRDFLDSEDGANLLTAYGRAANIVRVEEKRDGATYAGVVDETKFAQEEEAQLFARLAEARRDAEAALAREDFVAAMAALAGLRAPVDAFFDAVTVNTEEADLRINRLNLLAEIRATLDRVADFSQIEG